MKRLLWFSRGEKPVIEIVLDLESAQWLADAMSRDDRACIELKQAIEDLQATSTTEST